LGNVVDLSESSSAFSLPHPRGSAITAVNTIVNLKDLILSLLLLAKKLLKAPFQNQNSNLCYKRGIRGFFHRVASYDIASALLSSRMLYEELLRTK
jgi:hypothetical protein